MPYVAVTAMAIMARLVAILLAGCIPERKERMKETTMIAKPETMMEMRTLFAPKRTGATGMRAPIK
jgi:hypothetical protein